MSEIAAQPVAAAMRSTSISCNPRVRREHDHCRSLVPSDRSFARYASQSNEAERMAQKGDYSDHPLNIHSDVLPTVVLSILI